MNSAITKIIKPLVPKTIWDGTKNFLKKREERARQNQLVQDWYNSGCPAPPPHPIKQRTIHEYQRKFGNTVLVETGTYLGDMVEAQKRFFKKVISIELGPQLYENAKKRFLNDSNVTILHGDSGSVLVDVMKDLKTPAIFWLDGHYSGDITAKGDLECPIIAEIDAIFSTGLLNHVLLIDDARCFTGIGDYPTIEALVKYVQKKNERYQVEVKDDIIRLTTNK